MFTLPRTDHTLAALEEALCNNHGDMVAACRAVGVPTRHVAAWVAQDKSAADRIKTAQMIGWAALENAAYQRAVHGVEKGIYYKGELVGTETVYSDGLLQSMLKARVPAYGEGGGPSGGMTVNVAILPRASNYDEWVVQRERMLAKEAKSVTIDAEAPSASGPPPKLVLPAWEPQPPGPSVLSPAQSAVQRGRLRDVL